MIRKSANRKDFKMDNLQLFTTICFIFFEISLKNKQTMKRYWNDQKKIMKGWLPYEDKTFLQQLADNQVV